VQGVGHAVKDAVHWAKHSTSVPELRRRFEENPDNEGRQPEGTLRTPSELLTRIWPSRA
jgi:hypothetical protein